MRAGGEGKAPLAPMVTQLSCPPPPNQNPFQAFLQNIGRKWNLEGKFDILVTEIRFVNLMSFFYHQTIQCLFKNAKHCDSPYSSPYRVELLEG